MRRRMLLRGMTLKHSLVNWRALTAGSRASSVDVDQQNRGAICFNICAFAVTGKIIISLNQRHRGGSQMPVASKEKQ